MYTTSSNFWLIAHSDFTIAVATVNRSVAAWFKGYFGAFTTLGTYRGEHLTSGTVIAASVTFRFPCLAAFRTALGLINIALRLEKFLFLSAESESGSTVGALERLVLKTHWMTSSLDILVRVWSSNT